MPEGSDYTPGHLESDENLRKRLERLESRLTDGSGCVPYSAEWFPYWTRQAERLLARENVPKPPVVFSIPLARNGFPRIAASQFA
jgi:hypothetical protein